MTSYLATPQQPPVHSRHFDAAPILLGNNPFPFSSPLQFVGHFSPLMSTTSYGAPASQQPSQQTALFLSLDPCPPTFPSRLESCAPFAPSSPPPQKLYDSFSQPPTPVVTARPTMSGHSPYVDMIFQSPYYFGPYGPVGQGYDSLWPTGLGKEPWEEQESEESEESAESEELEESEESETTLKTTSEEAKRKKRKKKIKKGKPRKTRKAHKVTVVSSRAVRKLKPEKAKKPEASAKEKEEKEKKHKEEIDKGEKLTAFKVAVFSPKDLTILKPEESDKGEKLTVPKVAVVSPKASPRLKLRVPKKKVPVDIIETKPEKRVPIGKRTRQNSRRQIKRGASDLDHVRRILEQKIRTLDAFEKRALYHYEIPTISKLVQCKIPELFAPPILSTTPIYEYARSI